MPAIAANSDVTARSAAVPRAQLWFGLWGGAVAWSIHFLAAFLIAVFGCVGQLDKYRFANLSYVAWLEIAVTAVAVPIALAATLVAYRCSRHLSAGQAEHYLARAGFFTSGIFAFVILFEAIPILYYFHDC